MARQVNTLIPVYRSGDALFNAGIAEVVDKTIQMVGQTLTPFLSRTKSEIATSTVSEWIEDGYLPKEKTSRPYGDQMTPSTYQREKKRRVIQETRHLTHSVSEEEERTRKYGYSSTKNRLMMKQGISLRQGIESSWWNDNQGSQEALARNQYVGRSPQAQAIISRNGKKAASATNGGWNEAQNAFVARTPAANAGARVVLTLDDTIDMLDQVKQDYSDPMGHTELWMNRHFKAEFSGFSNQGLGAMRTQVGLGMQGQITRGISMIKTDLGRTVSLNWSPEIDDDNYNIYNINAGKVTYCYMFRNLQVRLAKKGLSEEFGLATNFSVKVKEEAGAAALYDRKVA